MHDPAIVHRIDPDFGVLICDVQKCLRRIQAHDAEHKMASPAVTLFRRIPALDVVKAILCFVAHQCLSQQFSDDEPMPPSIITAPGNTLLGKHRGEGFVTVSHSVLLFQVWVAFLYLRNDSIGDLTGKVFQIAQPVETKNGAAEVQIDTFIDHIAIFVV